jgi:hypothetical protein
MLDQVSFKHHLTESGPWLYHEVGRERMVASVLRDGLKPRSLTGENRNPHRPEINSRPDHVYLGSIEHLDFLCGRPSFQVELCVLDPICFDTDEDQVFRYLNLRFGRGGESAPNDLPELPGAAELEAARPRGAQSGGDWADDWHDVLDQPAWVAWSLSQGSLAYHGPVPLDALCLIAESQAGETQCAA